MMLLIDSGNSYIKWALTDGRKLYSSGRCKTQQVSALAEYWKAMDVPERVLVANVAGDAAADSISRIASTLWQSNAEIIHSPQQCCGLTNSYREPEKLGADRWVAMLAASKSSNGAVIVVDCGTAVTVDLVLPDGEFSGGVILPGLFSSSNSLHADTSSINAIQTTKPYNGPCARSTEEAVHAGVLLAVSGGIEKAIGEMSAVAEAAPEIIITGGDAEHIIPLLSPKNKHRPQLVLEGLMILARDRHEQ